MEPVITLPLQCFVESASFWGWTLARNKRSWMWRLKGSARKGDWDWWCEGWAQGVGGMGSSVRYLSGLLTASRMAPFMYVHSHPASVCVFAFPCIITHGQIAGGKGCHWGGRENQTTQLSPFSRHEPWSAVQRYFTWWRRVSEPPLVSVLARFVTVTGSAACTLPHPSGCGYWDTLSG